MRLIFLAVALFLSFGFARTSSAEQAKTPTLEIANAADQIADESTKRRQAEFDRAIADAKLEVIEAGNGRLEVLTGIFGILITVALGVAAFFTWKAAANAARSEVQDIRDKVEMLANQAEAHSANIAGHLDTAVAGVARIGALSEDAQATIANMTNPSAPKPTQEVAAEIESLANSAVTKPEGKRTIEELRALIYSARSQPDWAEMIELTKELEDAAGANSEIKADARLHRSTALHFLGQYEQATASWEQYLADFPDLSETNVATALYHWGNALARLARENNGDVAQAYWGQAVEKYRNALVLKPNDPDILNNSGLTLLHYAQCKGVDREMLLKELELNFLRADEIIRGMGSYKLACQHAERNDVEGAVRWLIHCKEQQRRFPGFERIAKEPCFEPVRSHPAFQQALKDLGFKPDDPFIPRQMD